MVTPMELQVLFMQESRAASETDKSRRFPAQKRAQRARQKIAETKRESVDKVDTTETKTVDEEGGQGSAGYFAQRKQQDPELAEEEKNKTPTTEEEGKGDVMDLTI